MLQFPKHKLIQNCPIWWESTLMMLKHVPKQQAAIAARFTKGRQQHLMPEGDGERRNLKASTQTLFTECLTK